MTTSIATTLGDLVEAQSALASVAGKMDGKAVPMKAKYHVGKLLRLVNAECKDFYEQRDVLIKELGAARDPTAAERQRGMLDRVHEVTAENGPMFAKRLKELSEVPVSIAWEPVDLANLEDTTIAAAEIAILLDAGLAVFECADPKT